MAESFVLCQNAQTGVLLYRFQNVKLKLFFLYETNVVFWVVSIHCAFSAFTVHSYPYSRFFCYHVIIDSYNIRSMHSPWHSTCKNYYGIEILNFGSPYIIIQGYTLSLVFVNQTLTKLLYVSLEFLCALFWQEEVDIDDACYSSHTNLCAYWKTASHVLSENCCCTCVQNTNIQCRTKTISMYISVFKSQQTWVPFWRTASAIKAS